MPPAGMVEAEGARPCTTWGVQAISRPRRGTIERTVVNGPNRGRKCAFCPKERDDPTNCGFVAVYPQCLCGLAAQKKTVGPGRPNSGRQFYSCGKRNGGWCNWFGGWADDSSFGSPSKRARYG